ncbi:hypothetical protein GGI35DRAFT_13142 [Trichoderma velutinum]
MRCSSGHQDGIRRPLESEAGRVCCGHILAAFVLIMLTSDFLRSRIFLFTLFRLKKGQGLGQDTGRSFGPLFMIRFSSSNALRCALQCCLRLFLFIIRDVTLSFFSPLDPPPLALLVWVCWSLDILGHWLVFGFCLKGLVFGLALSLGHCRSLMTVNWRNLRFRWMDGPNSRTSNPRID